MIRTAACLSLMLLLSPAVAHAADENAALREEIDNLRSDVAYLSTALQAMTVCLQALYEDRYQNPSPPPPMIFRGETVPPVQGSRFLAHDCFADFGWAKSAARAIADRSGMNSSDLDWLRAPHRPPEKEP